MAHAAYPTADDVLAFLEGAGLTVSDALQDFLEDAAEAGQREFERRTGIKPFLAGTAATRYLDPPTRSRELVLPVPLAALTSVTYQPTGSTATVYTLNTDYSAYPRNYAVEGVPITRLRFATNRWLDPLSIAFRGSLAILGQWGYATTIPSDAWLAMCALGAMHLSPQLGQALRNGLVRWSEKDRSEQYEEGLETLAAGWEMRVARAVNSYRRVIF
jgi:hypothetical protein